MSSKVFVTQINANSVTTNSFAQILTTYTDLQATDILLLSAIMDRYFDDSYGFSETTAIAFAKALPDSITMVEDLAAVLSKALTESQSLADSLALSASKVSSDSISIGDSFVYTIPGHSILNRSVLNAFTFNQ